MKKSKPPTLSATSALVLLWSGFESYPSYQAQQYLKMLDLDTGESLYKKCKKVWPHYEQVIINRKFAILYLIEQCRRQNPNLHQMVILGAGLAPLSIEALTRHPKLRIFDIDAEQMTLKKKLLNELKDDSLSTINCLTANLANLKSLNKELTSGGWKPKEPTLVVLEGVSYYLELEKIHRLMDLFKNKDNKSRIILEYLLPFENIAPANRDIPRKIFDLIAKACGLAHITQLEYGKIKNWEGLSLLKRLTMHDIEKMRTGSNEYFPSKDSGWIEVSLLVC